MTLKSGSISFTASLSYTGVVVAVLFFAISLSPSLVPRPFLLQGTLSGVLLALGYCIGFLIAQLWLYLQLPILKKNNLTLSRIVVGSLSAFLFCYAIYFSTNWQNELRNQMGLPEAALSSHLTMTMVALGLAFLLLLCVRFLNKLVIYLKLRFKKVIPQRIAHTLSTLLLASVIFFLTNNLLVSKFVSVLDDTYQLLDENIESDLSPPVNMLATGSSASLIKWQTLGRTGQDFISEGPTQAQLSDYFKEAVKHPIRVYAGLRSTETVEQRAELALQELIRVDAFKRSKLVIATPTGTGWLDPSAVDTFEYLHKGDTAIVAMQYSYLPSWLTLLVDPSAARVTATTLYNKVHHYWSKLPEDSRPDLYLFGLSLGAFGAETSINLTTVIKNPIQGALFVGTPFTSVLSPLLTRYRNPDSPQWLPVIQDSSMVRYTGQKNSLENPEWKWGPMRFVYIQYASDPIVFFSTDLYRREPDWMKGERGHDVSSEFRWFPVVTFFQVLFDLPMAEKVPRGNAHNYSASSYINGWISVTDPENWDKDDVENLKLQFNGR